MAHLSRHLLPPWVRDFIENIRRSHKQIIDNTNPNTVIFAGFDAQKE